MSSSSVKHGAYSFIKVNAEECISRVCGRCSTRQKVASAHVLFFLCGNPSSSCTSLSIRIVASLKPLFRCIPCAQHKRAIAVAKATGWTWGWSSFSTSTCERRYARRLSCTSCATHLSFAAATGITRPRCPLLLAFCFLCCRGAHSACRLLFLIASPLNSLEQARCKCSSFSSSALRLPPRCLHVLRASCFLAGA